MKNTCIVATVSYSNVRQVAKCGQESVIFLLTVVCAGGFPFLMFKEIPGAQHLGQRN